MTSPKGRKQRLYYSLFHMSNHLNPFTQILFRDYPILNSHNRHFSQCFLFHNVVLSKLKSSFENWYSELIVAQIKKNGSDEVPIEPVHLSITVLKELVSKWLVKMHQEVSNQNELITNRFRSAGILKALEEYVSVGLIQI